MLSLSSCAKGDCEVVNTGFEVMDMGDQQQALASNTFLNLKVLNTKERSQDPHSPSGSNSLQKTSFGKYYPLF